MTEPNVSAAVGTRSEYDDFLRRSIFSVVTDEAVRGENLAYQYPKNSDETYRELLFRGVECDYHDTESWGRLCGVKTADGALQWNRHHADKLIGELVQAGRLHHVAARRVRDGQSWSEWIRLAHPELFQEALAHAE